MTQDQLAHILEKAAEYTSSLEVENADLKEKLAEQSLLRTSGESLEKVAEAADLEVKEAYEALKTLTPAQRKILEKTASEEDFRLGDVSELSSSEVDDSADARFLAFMEN
jgi:hypothetical protein